MVDPEIVSRHLRDLDECLAALDELRPVSAAALRKDRMLRAHVLYHLQRAIQNLLDVGSHLLADRGRAVAEYSEIFSGLADERLIGDALAGRVADVSKFRNVLVHGYIELNLDIVAEVVNERLQDLRELARQLDAAP